MRDALTLKDVAQLLPLDGPGGQLLRIADQLRARAGHVQQCLFRLEDIGAARVVWDDVNGSAWWRIAGVEIPNVSVRAGEAARKPPGAPAIDAGAGNVGLQEGGGAARKKLDQPLALYGENKDRPRVPFDAIRAVETNKDRRARQFAREAFARSETIAVKGDAAQLLGVLAVEADALSDAADIVRARIKRLTKEALAKTDEKPSVETGAVAPSSG
jgi:hypothetical protein